MSCPDCFKGVAFDEQPKGVISDINGAYFVPAKGDNITTTRAVVVLTDIFGLVLPNPKVLADLYAEQLGCDVWVPDLFAGKSPVPPDAMLHPERAGQRFTVWEWIQVIFHMLTYLPGLIRQRPTVTDPRVRDFITKLKAQKNYEKIGAVGFCYGGSTAVRFGATDTFDTIAICHPGWHKLADFKAVKVPCFWALAEDDMMFTEKVQRVAEAEFAGRVGKDNYVEYEFNKYQGTVHGFAVRPQLAFPEVKEAFERVQQQIVGWFQKTLIA